MYVKLILDWFDPRFCKIKSVQSNTGDPLKSFKWGGGGVGGPEGTRKYLGLYES